MELGSKAYQKDSTLSQSGSTIAKVIGDADISGSLSISQYDIIAVKNMYCKGGWRFCLHSDDGIKSCYFDTDLQDPTKMTYVDVTSIGSSYTNGVKKYEFHNVGGYYIQACTEINGGGGMFHSLTISRIESTHILPF